MKYLKTEIEFIHKILKQGGAKQEDKEMIFLLYQKYIDTTLVRYDINTCSTCSSSLNRIWQAIKEYILTNGELFIN